jgi:pimeloyl-ACP methyl ester carboxylesterase
MILTERLWEGGDVALNVASSSAAGPPLLLLHSVSRRWRCFDPLLPALLPNWQVFALDQRGHGRSKRAESYLAIDYVRDAAAFLRDSIAGPTVVYGAGMAGLQALALAAELPDRVRAVVLEDPLLPAALINLRNMPHFTVLTVMQGLTGSEKPIPAKAHELAELRLQQGAKRVQFGEAREALFFRFMARCLVDLDPETLTPIVEGQYFNDFDLDAVAAAATCPVLLLRADELQGGYLTRAEATGLAAKLSDCIGVEAPGCGNLMHWLDTPLVAHAVVSFLASL